MATYNGEAFVEEQIASILAELQPSDELVVVDDGSTDRTVELVGLVGDERVRCLCNTTNQGHVRAFATAISLARGDVILLSDQDDIWPPGRVNIMLSALRDATLVAGGLDSLHEGGPVYSWTRPRASGPVKGVAGLLLGTHPYFGSAMGFRTELRKLILPFPAYVEAHDHWIAIVANIVGPVSHSAQVVVHRRVHSANLTRSNRGLTERFRTRCIDVLSTAEAVWRAGRRGPAVRRTN